VKHVSPSAQYTACFIKKFQAPFLTHFNSYTVIPRLTSDPANDFFG